MRNKTGWGKAEESSYIFIAKTSTIMSAVNEMEILKAIVSRGSVAELCGDP